MDAVASICFAPDYFMKKSKLAASKIITCTNPRKKLIYYANMRLNCRNKGANLRKNNNERDLPNIGGFTCHIGPCNQHEIFLFAIQRDVIGNKLAKRGER